MRKKFRIFIVFLLLIIISEHSLSQDSIQSQRSIIFSTNIEFSKIDFFHNIQVNTELFEFLSLEAAIGVNANKTYYQRSFAPQFSLAVGYDLLRNKNKWKLIPMLKSRTTMIDLSENSRLSYVEGYVGYSLIFGSKWYLTHNAFLGKGIEFYNDINSRESFWSYSVNLGLGYEF